MEEVPDTNAFRLDVMADDRAGNVKNLSSGDVEADTNRKLGFLTSQRKNSQPTHLRVEGTDLVKEVAAKRHCGSDEVTDGSDGLGQAGIAAADDPIELGRQPYGPLSRPDGRRSTSRTYHGRIAVLRQQLLEPTGIGLSIIVEEGHDVASRCPHARVAGAR
jgi:hypothetical protein